MRANRRCVIRIKVAWQLPCVVSYVIDVICYHGIDGYQATRREEKNISAAAGSTSQTFRVFSVIRFLESKEEFSVVCYIIWWKEQIRIIVEITLGFKISGKTSLNALTSPWKARTNGGWVSDLALSISKLFSLLCRGRNKSLQDFKDTKLQL